MFNQREEPCSTRGMSHFLKSRGSRHIQREGGAMFNEWEEECSIQRDEACFTRGWRQIHQEGGAIIYMPRVEAYVLPEGGGMFNQREEVCSARGRRIVLFRGRRNILP